MGMLERFEKRLVGGNRILIGIMMGIMFALVFTNVITRYVFGFSIATAEEISTFLMIWVTYLGAGLALRAGNLASIDAFQDRLPENLRRGLRAFLALLMLLFFLLLVYFGIRFCVLGWSQETFATQIPRGIPYLVIPLGALLFAAHLILMFRHWLDRKWDGPPVSDLSEDQERKVQP
jgi:TRAP-type C4-dicarboxylate transport system permease small subunit